MTIRTGCIIVTTICAVGAVVLACVGHDVAAFASGFCAFVAFGSFTESDDK
jgi:hypothetical protein